MTARTPAERPPRRIGDATDTASNLLEDDSYGVLARLGLTGTGTVTYREAVTGRPISEKQAQGRVIRYPDGRHIHAQAAPEFTGPEADYAAATIREAFNHIEQAYPQLAQILLDNPSLLPYLPETQLMVAPDDPQNTGIAADLTAALLENPTDPARLSDFTVQTRQGGTVAVFWTQIASQWDADERAAAAHMLASLTPSGADSVAADALRWWDTHQNRPEALETLLVNLSQWATQQQQHELGHRGLWGVLDAPQEYVGDPLFTGIVDFIAKAFTTPEEQARRRDLSYGEKISALLGFQPAYREGEGPVFGMSWDEIVSGVNDAHGEIGHDPLNLLAGAGAFVKAVKTVPLARSAAQAGKLRVAARTARAFLAPRRLSGVSKPIRGGRIARAGYAFGAKTVDELFAATAKSGVAEDIRKLLAAGDNVRFEQKYPQFKYLTPTVRKTIAAADSPELVAEIFRVAAYDEILLRPDTLADAERTLAEAWDGVDAATTPAQKLEAVYKYTPEQTARMQRYSAYDDTTQVAEKYARPIWQEHTPKRIGGFTLRKADYRVYASTRATAQGTSTPVRRNTVTVYDDSGTLVGYADGHVFREARKGVMTEALNIAEDAGRSFLPDMLRKAELAEIGQDAHRLTKPEAAFLREAASERLHGARTPSGAALAPLLRIVDKPLARKVILAETRLDAARQALKGENLFIVTDVPRKPPRPKRFSYDNIPGVTRQAQFARRIVAKTSGPAVEGEISLSDSAKGAAQVAKLFRHYGAEQSFIDAAVNKFLELDVHDRWTWVMDEMLPGLGEHVDVPLLHLHLNQYYQRLGLRKYGQNDTYVDPSGVAHSSPIMRTQLTDTVPVPVAQMDQIYKRSKSIGNRSRAAKALGFRGRGYGATAANRTNLTRRYFNILQRRGAFSEDITFEALPYHQQEALYNMAFSTVSDHGIDGRGLLASQLLPRAGSLWAGLMSAFTQSMLVLRPFQWAFRVFSEEQMRGFMFNLPSLYRNPVAYMADYLTSHKIALIEKDQTRIARAAEEAHRHIMSNADPVMVDRLRKAGLFDPPADGSDLTLPEVSQRLTSILQKRDVVPLHKLAATPAASFLIRRSARRLDKAQRALKEIGLAEDFSLADDLPEMQNVFLPVYIARQAQASHIGRVQWAPTMTSEERVRYGYAYGQKLIQTLDSPDATFALRRLAARIRERTNHPILQDRRIISSSWWPEMRPVIARRWPGIEDEAELAGKWMTEVLEPEVENLIAPLLKAVESSADEAKIVMQLANDRTYRQTLNGYKYDISLRGSNLAEAASQFSKMVEDQAPFAATTLFPEELYAIAFDPRFLSTDDMKLAVKAKNAVLHFFGERVTQQLNRRPAFIREQRRWYNHYRDLHVPEKLAGLMASRQAVETVNHVYYSTANAPFIVNTLNRHIPFFGAFYEVSSTWAYKLPQAVGGYWATGVGEFARKLQRFVDGLVAVGLVTREEEDDGTIRHMIHLGEVDRHSPLGEALGDIGHQAVQGLIGMTGHFLNMIVETDTDGLYSGGATLAVGHPLNPFDYGMLSFAQAEIGLNPLPNFLASTAAPLIGLAADDKKTVTRQNETLADIASRLEVDAEKLARYNRALLVAIDDGITYDRLLYGLTTADEIVLPEGENVAVPGSSLWDAAESLFMPFGTIKDPSDIPMNFVPGVIRWGLMGLGIATTPTDAFWEGDFDRGFLGSFIPEANQAQMASQVSEAMMYLEAHDRIGGAGPMQRIEDKKVRLAGLLDKPPSEETRGHINRLRIEIEIDQDEYLERVRNLAASGMVQRMMIGQMLPTSPRHLREGQEKINDFWKSREYADKLKAGGQGINNLRPFKNRAELDRFFEQTAGWLRDHTGDDSRATFLKELPQLFAYLTPKSFWAESGVPPQISSFEEYNERLVAGDIIAAPLAVTIGRARSSFIQADFYNQIQAEFGGETAYDTAANALYDYERYQSLLGDKRTQYAGLFLEDDFQGGQYLEWLQRHEGDTDYALEKYVERDEELQASIGTLLSLEAELDETYNLSEIVKLRTSIKAAAAKISDVIEQWEEEAGLSNDFRNPFEEIIHRYWKEVYDPYSQRIGALYDRVALSRDSEERALIYEEIKHVRNEYVGAETLFPGSTAVFPSPLHIQWARKTEQERDVFVQKRLINPVEWLGLDAVQHILEAAPQLAGHVPDSDADMDIYREWALNKVLVDEAYEREEITSYGRTKALNRIEQEIREHLLATGRQGEVVFMDLYPIERLAAAGMLPPSIGRYLEAVRYYKRILQVKDYGPNSKKGRILLDPLYQLVRADAESDEQLRADLDDIGTYLYDQVTVDDQLLPMFFFGQWQLQED